MKKTVIIILAVLPIVLLITISFAGRIFSIYRHVPVEKVQFVDEEGEKVRDDYFLKVNVGETKGTEIQIFPELASNKSVSYTSTDNSVCTVDKEGNVTGVSSGMASVLVKTVDGSKTALLGIRVVAENVTGVTLSQTEMELVPGAYQMLSAIVEPYTALNKNVVYSTDNPSVVSVNANGKITAISIGTATVTVTTADGGFTASCRVTVKAGEPLFAFDFTGAPEFVQSGVGYIVSASTVDLTPYIKINSEEISLSDVKLKINSGDATLDGNVLTFNQNPVVIIVAYTGSDEAPQHQIELRLLHYS